MSATKLLVRRVSMRREFIASRGTHNNRAHSRWDNNAGYAHRSYARRRVERDSYAISSAHPRREYKTLPFTIAEHPPDEPVDLITPWSMVVVPLAGNWVLPAANPLGVCTRHHSHVIRSTPADQNNTGPPWGPSHEVWFGNARETDGTDDLVGRGRQGSQVVFRTGNSRGVRAVNAPRYTNQRENEKEVTHNAEHEPPEPAATDPRL